MARHAVKLREPRVNDSLLCADDVKVYRIVAIHPLPSGAWQIVLQRGDYAIGGVVTRSVRVSELSKLVPCDGCALCVYADGHMVTGNIRTGEMPS